MMVNEYAFHTLYREHEARLTAELERRRLQEEREATAVTPPSGIVAALFRWRPAPRHAH
ncbi:hypothetical protein HQQ81_00370 [Microbacteriaceae bacterium VKM Ac-2854]|nr:hypothetical protein [Microbacteriaceae bacterium VKM Ac-2854]